MCTELTCLYHGERNRRERGIDDLVTVNWDSLSGSIRAVLIHAHDLDGICRKNRNGSPCLTE